MPLLHSKYSWSLHAAGDCIADSGIEASARQQPSSQPKRNDETKIRPLTTYDIVW